MITFLKKYLKQNKINLALLLIGFALAVVGVWHWFSNNSIIYFVDSLVPLDAKNSFIRIFYGIDSHTYPWNIEANWSWFLYWGIIALGNKILGTLSLSQMFLYIFLLFSSISGFYLMLNYLITIFFKEEATKLIYKIISFTFALFYTFNLFTFFYAFFMFNPDAFLIAFLPLNLLALFKIFPLRGLKKGSSRWLIVFFATLFLISPGFLTYIFLPQYLAWIGLYLLIFLFSSKINIISKKFFLMAVFSALILFSIWWWLFPALLALKDIYAVQSSTGTTLWFDMGFEPSKLLNSFRLIGTPLMYGNQFSWTHFYIDDKFFTFPLFTFPILAIVFAFSLKLVRSKGTFLYLLIMLTVSLFLVKFSNPPLASITKFAFEHVPFFGAFRDSYHKAGIYYLLPFLLICGLGASIAIKIISKKKQKYLLVLFMALLLIVGVVVTGPFFLFAKDNIRTEAFNNNNQQHIIKSKTQIPSEYYELKRIFEPECRGKTVMVVPRGGWVSSAEWQKYGTSYIGVDLLPQLLNCSFITTLAYQPEAESSNQAPYILLQNDEHQAFKEFLFKNQISFVLVRHDNVPFYFSNYLYVDPNTTSAWLDQDKDFEKKVINQYFTIYSLKRLDKINTYGFGFSTNSTYINSPLLSSAAYATVSKRTPDIINPVVINTTEDLSKYDFTAKNYLAIGECADCSNKGEIERLELGTKTKSLNFKINIAKSGNYFCAANVYAKGAKINNITIDGKDGEKINMDTLTPTFFGKGMYDARVSYNTPVFIDEKLLSIFPGQVIELPVGRDDERNNRLSYVLDNQSQNIEIVFAKKKLSQSTLEKKSFNPEDIVFTNPGGISEKEQAFSRIMQLDELNVNNYYIYIISDKTGNKDEPATIKNLLLEKAIDTNYVDVSCLLNDVSSKDFASELVVKQISPIEYKLKLSSNFQEGFLTFNKTYNLDWQAYSDIGNNMQVLPHFQSGYGNAWYVKDPESKEITVKFTRFDLITKNALISLILFLILFIYYFKANKNNR